MPLLAASNDGKDLEGTIVALDGLPSDRCQRDAIPDMSGDDRVHQYLRVLRQAAKPRRQIDDVSDRRVVETSLVAEGPDGRGSHRDADAETNGAAAGVPWMRAGRRLLNRWIAATIAYRERQTVWLELHRAGDRDLNNIYRGPIDDALEKAARLRQRFMQR